jgi:hypothetical protein
MIIYYKVMAGFAIERNGKAKNYPAVLVSELILP